MAIEIMIAMNEIQGIFLKYLDFKFMFDDCDTWIEMENESTYIPVEYTYHMISYQNCYYREVYEDLLNISIIVYSGGRAIALWPLCLYINNGKYYISAWGGDYICAPILCRDGIKHDTARKFFRNCFGALLKLCEYLKIDNFITKEIIMQNGISIWMQLLLENGAYCIRNTIECFLDLGLDEESILKRIRRTNRYSIMKGEKRWKTSIITLSSDESIIDQVFDDFENLHIDIAKRRTRSHDTWIYQRESIKNSNSFVVTLYDNSGFLVGVSLFQTSRTSCYYSVAAYRREYFDQPLAHVSQWNAIKHMKSLDLKWYHIGERAYEWLNPTDKEIAIGYFKEGFSTHMFNSMYVKFNVIM